jgi:hypothetical protein
MMFPEKTSLLLRNTGCVATVGCETPAREASSQASQLLLRYTPPSLLIPPPPSPLSPSRPRIEGKAVTTIRYINGVVGVVVMMSPADWPTG